MTTQYLAYSRELTGYRVRARAREAFRVVGFTLLVPAGRKGGGMVPAFAGEVIADGRLAKLIAASAVPPWVLGLGSWDPECEPHGQRYTICIEETGHTDFTRLAGEYPLFAKEIGASDWLCFELEDGDEERFWRDDPYKMMGKPGTPSTRGRATMAWVCTLTPFRPASATAAPMPGNPWSSG